MREIILKIIEKNISHYQLQDDSDPIVITGKDVCATKVAELIEKFETWKMKNSWYNSPANDYTVANEKTYRMMSLTYDDLFSYWFENIHTKK